MRVRPSGRRVGRFERGAPYERRGADGLLLEEGHTLDGSRVRPGCLESITLRDQHALPLGRHSLCRRLRVEDNVDPEGVLGDPVRTGILGRTDRCAHDELTRPELGHRRRWGASWRGRPLAAGRDPGDAQGNEEPESHPALGLASCSRTYPSGVYRWHATCTSPTGLGAGSTSWTRPRGDVGG